MHVKKRSESGAGGSGEALIQVNGRFAVRLSNID
jgi:hypothetical protein